MENYFLFLLATLPEMVEFFSAAESAGVSWREGCRDCWGCLSVLS